MITSRLSCLFWILSVLTIAACGAGVEPEQEATPTVEYPLIHLNHEIEEGEEAGGHESFPRDTTQLLDATIEDSRGQFLVTGLSEEQELTFLATSIVLVDKSGQTIRLNADDENEGPPAGAPCLQCFCQSDECYCPACPEGE